MTEKFIIIVGNVVDGLTFFGPFDDGNEATDWASEEIRDTWSCVKLESPEA